MSKEQAFTSLLILIGICFVVGVVNIVATVIFGWLGLIVGAILGGAIIYAFACPLFGEESE